MTVTPVTLLGVWAVGAEVTFSVGIGFEHAVVIVPLLMVIMGAYGGTVAASSAAQLLLVDLYMIQQVLFQLII